ncbi:MAG: GAF domain-containing sensor histidine kinase [Chloroflexi bacterium]|nr:GAF domain-containing sensor histidine kinase [Chloroflexota bacterium]
MAKHDRILIALGLVGLALLVGLEILLLSSGVLAWPIWVLFGLTALWLGVAAYRLAILRRDLALRQHLLEIGRELASLRESGELLDHLVEAVARLIPQADKCVIHLLGPGGKRLFPRYTTAPTPGPSMGMPADQGVAGQALQERRVIRVADVTKEPAFLPLSSGSDLRALLVAPFYVAEQPLGTLSLNSRIPGAFSARDAEIVSILAGFASNVFYQSRALAQGQLQSSHLAAVVDLLEDGILILDEAGRILRHNAALPQVVGLGMRDLTGLSVSEDSSDEALRRLARLVSALDSTPDRGIQRLMALEGAPQTRLRVIRTPFTDRDGNRLQIIVIRDESEHLRQLHTQQALAAAAGLELWALQKRVLEGEPHQASALAAEMRRLAANLADPCLLDGSPSLLHREPVDFSALLLEVYRRFGQMADVSSGLLAIKCPDEVPPILGDAERLTRALLCLLANVAHRAGEDTEAILRVTVEGDILSVTLQDTGTPISASERERILSHPFALGDALPTDPAGTGFDLYAAKRIIEAHGGQLWLADASGGKTEFRIVLPIAPAL